MLENKLPMRLTLLLLLVIFHFSLLAQKKGKDKDTTRSLDPVGDIYRTALKQIDSTNYKAAIVILKKAIKQNSKYADAFTKMAYCKMHLNDLKGASKDLETSLKIAPDNYECTKSLGRILFMDKRYDDAKKRYDDAYKIDPQDPELIY